MTRGTLLWQCRCLVVGLTVLEFVFALCGLFISASPTFEHSIHSSCTFKNPLPSSVHGRPWTLCVAEKVDECGRDGHPLVVDAARVASRVADREANNIGFLIGRYEGRPSSACYDGQYCQRIDQGLMTCRINTFVRA